MGTKIHRRKGGLAFYELPNSVRSCAEVISEARIEMSDKINGIMAMAPGGIRAVDTKRPFTPRENQRTLFGRDRRVGVSRPPSSVSLKYLQTEKIDGEGIKPVPWLITKPPRPVQQPLKRSEAMKFPLPSPCLPLGNHSRVKLPDLAIPVKQELKPARQIRLQFHAASLVNLPEENEEKLHVDTAETSKIICKAHSFDSRVKEKKHAKSSDKKAKKGGDDKSEAVVKATEMSLVDTSKLEKMAVTDSHNQKRDIFSHKCPQDLAVNKSIHINVSSKGNIYAPESSTSNSHCQKTCNSYVEEGKKEPVKIVSRGGESEVKRFCFDQIMELTQKLNGESARENNEAKIIALMQNLFEILDSNNLLGTKLSTKNKALILRSVFKFVERSSYEVLLEVARIILGLSVTGCNLAGVCKLIFKISRSDDNDHLFLRGNVLELFINALGTAEPMEDAEACVYGYGALKFLLMNSRLRRKILSFGALELMVLHMKVINKWKMEGGIISEQTCHALFQLTGALRNVAGEEEEPFPNEFVTSGVVYELCNTLYLFSCDLDIVSNASRTLSILSTHDICCSAIIDHECSMKTLVKLLKKFPGRQDIIVRLCYVLGNVMAKNDKARLKFYNEEDSLSCLIELLFKYINLESRVSPHVSCIPQVKSHTPSSSNVDDVLIKVVRVIANMSISPLVGMSVAGLDKEEGNHETCGKLLDTLVAILHSHEVRDSPELVVCVLATLNNLSFWAVGVENEEFSKRQIEVAEVLHSYITEGHKETLAEAIRVFGNLSQSKEVREYMIENGTLEKLLQLMQKPTDLSKDILVASVGILVNMMADSDNRRIFAGQSGISRLLVMLESTNGKDWNLASLICQVIWNYIIESQDLYADLGKKETDKLVTVLADFLDEEHYFGIPEGSDVDPAISMTRAYQEWEDFATVATDLLEKIEAFLDSSYFNSVFIEESDPYQSR